MTTNPGYTDIDLSAWYDPDRVPERSIRIPEGMGRILSLSIYDIPMMMHDPEAFVADKMIRQSGTDAVTRSFINSVFSAVCSEQDVILDQGDPMEKYTRSLFSRLESGEDTGLAPAGGMEAWSLLSASEKKRVKRHVVDSAHEIQEEFPDPATLNIVDVMLPLRIDWGSDILSANAPVTVETKAGLCAVIIKPVEVVDSTADASVIGLSSSVNATHIWNTSTWMISPAQGDESIDAARAMMDISTAWMRQKK